MKRLVALAALFGLVSAAPAENGPIFAGPPPYRFMGDATAIVVFTNDITAMCGEAPLGYVILGCHHRTRDGVSVISLPNPCLFPEEMYARIACHEKGHSLGWGGNHEL